MAGDSRSGLREKNMPTDLDTDATTSQKRTAIRSPVSYLRVMAQAITIPKTVNSSARPLNVTPDAFPQYAMETVAENGHWYEHVSFLGFVIFNSRSVRANIET